MRPYAIQIAPLIALITAALVLAGCSSSLVKTTPKLPPGFLETLVPAGDLSAYMYVSQGSAVTIPLQRFGDASLVQGVPGLPAIPERVEIDQMVLVVGPDLDSFGGSVTFGQDGLAEMAQALLSQRSDDVTSWRDARRVNLVRGNSGWADSLQSAMRSGDVSRFQDAYPDIWELMRLLPERPPGEPVAAGFLKVDTGLLDSLSSKAGLGLSGLGQALGAIRITDVAYVAYTDNTSLALPEYVGRDYLVEVGVGAVFVVRSSYPGFLLSFFLDTFADRVGLQKGTEVSGEDVLFKDLDGMYLVAKPLGDTLVLSLAPTRERAEALMAAVLEPQTRE